MSRRELDEGDPGGLGVSALVDRRHRPAGDQRPLSSATGPLGIVRDAALVIEDGARRRRRAGGRGRRRAASTPAGAASSPGFVDSHTHLVFAGDRADEFAARMAGAPYEAGGIRVTTEATRARPPTSELARAGRAPPGRGAARRDHPPRDQVRLRARRRDTSSGCARSPPSSPTTSPSSAPTSSRPSTRAAPTTTSSSSAARCSRPARPTRAGSTSSASAGAFDADQSRAVLEAGRAAGLGLRVHGNQLGPGPGVRLAVELGAASVDHCTYLDDADVEALAGERDGRHLPAGDRLLDPPALSRRAAGDRRGRLGRDRDQHQPGLEQHDLDELLHRARRPRACG